MSSEVLNSSRLQLGFIKSSMMKIKNEIYDYLEHGDGQIEEYSFWEKFPFCGYELKHYIKQINLSQKDFAKKITPLILDNDEIDKRMEKSYEDYHKRTKDEFLKKHKPHLIKKRYEEESDVTVSRSFVERKFAMGWRLLTTSQDMMILDDIIDEAYSRPWLIDTRKTFFIVNKDEFFELYNDLVI